MKVFKINLGSDNPSPLSGRFWTKALVMALAIFICSLLFKFVDVSSPLAAVVAALVISLLNAFLKPLLTLISAPLILMSFGLFQLIINAVIVLFTSHLVKGFHVGGLLDAVLFSIVVTFISFLLDLPIKIKRMKDALFPKEDRDFKEDEEFTPYEEVDSTTEDEDKEEKQ